MKVSGGYHHFLLYSDYLINKRERKPKEQVDMDNLEKLAKLNTQDTGRRQKKTTTLKAKTMGITKTPSEPNRIRKEHTGMCNGLTRATIEVSIGK